MKMLMKGILTIDDPRGTVCPGLKSEDFTKSRLSSVFKLDFSSTEVAVYSGRCLVLGGWAWVIISFQCNIVDRVLIQLDAGVKRYEDWDETKTQLWKEKVERMLREELGPPPYELGWGRIVGGSERDIGKPMISITYY